ncbi:MAG: hypothetical protein MJY79_02095, partial [Bacteroidaceae bacterium]|nr:hypothetical protein [Bacteroidaceae bacterium]
MHQFNQIFPQEKVYLQFDNTAYFQGETIWFKAFAVKASHLERSQSSVLYVELLSPNGVLLQRQKLKLIAGQCDGCIKLVDSMTEQARSLISSKPYPSGYYEVRAYTRNMLNFHDDLCFSRVFPVYEDAPEGAYRFASVLENSKSWLGSYRPKEAKKNTVNIEFFPEGGSLIFKQQCNVAFKVTDANGAPLDGILEIEKEADANGRKITASTEHDGMGSFVITPAFSHIQAQFEYDGKRTKISLPKTESSGYSIITDCTDNDSVNIAIYRTADCREDTIGMAVSCRGELVSFSIVPIRALKKQVSVSAEDWPIGVCQLCLFTRSGKILAYRSLFHTNMEFEPPKFRLAANRQVFNPLDSISLKLNLSYKGEPLQDRFALSVRDAQDYGTLYSDNLLTNLLLSSDLKGFIRNPEYYFESNDSVHRRAADLLMLVQGWKRYDWEFSSSDKSFAEKYRMEDSLAVNGWIRKNNGTPLKDINVMIAISPEEEITVELGKYKTEDIGYFGFNTKDFYGNATLSMRLTEDNRKKAVPKAKMILERAMLPKTRSFDGIEKMLANSHKKAYMQLEVLDSRPDTAVGQMLQNYMLPDVDISEKVKYLDYFTFKAFNVQDDVEMTLDLGENTTDLIGYLLDKGYTMFVMSAIPDSIGKEFDSNRNTEKIAYSDGTFIDGFPVFWYLHTQSASAYEPGVIPWSINTEHIKSMIVYDDPVTIREVSNEVPLFIEAINRHNNIEVQNYMRGNESQKKYYLVDVRLKESYQYPSAAELNTGTRITTLKGFNHPVQFYSPQYPDGPIEGQPKDYRRTLYWNPNVITDSLGYAEV